MSHHDACMLLHIPMMSWQAGVCVHVRMALCLQRVPSKGASCISALRHVYEPSIIYYISRRLLGARQVCLTLILSAQTAGLRCIDNPRSST